MKFTDGYWNIREGYQPYYLAQIHEIEFDSNSLTVYGATKHLNHRGDTVNLPIITVRFSSPMLDVIRIQICHHKGYLQRHPYFRLLEHLDTRVSLRENDAFASLTSGKLTASVAKGNDWRLEFLDGETVITGSGGRGIGFVDTPSGRFIHEQLNLGVGEYIYGLGERFTPFVKNGQVIDLWNEDGGTSSEQAYKNIPFFLTNRGYGVFINHPEKVFARGGIRKG